MKSSKITLVYLAAGLSSRFKGKIKQFAQVGPNNEKLIEYSLNKALQAGFNKIIFVVNKKTEQLFKENFKNSYKGIPVYYTIQHYNPEKRDKPWGTTDALCTIKNIINSPFVVCNSDDIYEKEIFQILINHLTNCNYEATIGYKLIESLPEKSEVNRAIFKIDENNFVTELREYFNISKLNFHEKNLSPNDFCSRNVFALHPEILDKLNIQLQKFKESNENSRTAECLLPNELSNLIKSGFIKMKLYPTNSKCFGITYPEDEKTVREIIKNIEKNA